jgi:clan AA aspartic protease
VNGIVDESQRALLDVYLSADKDGKQESLTVWIDTAFNGGLVIPRPQVERLGLKQASTTQAILADGHVVDLETFTCYLHWVGKVYRTQVVANDGEFPLLGTILLAARKLVIDYASKSVVLS